MPASKKRIIFVEHKPFSDQELETVLSGTDSLPWFRAVTQVIRKHKDDCMDQIGQSVGLNNMLAVTHGAGGMDLADNLLVQLHSLCSPKPE